MKKSFADIFWISLLILMCCIMLSDNELIRVRLNLAWTETDSTCLSMNQNSPADMVTGYELGDRGTIFCRGMDFVLSIESSPALGYTQPPIKWVLGTLSPRVQLLGLILKVIN
jgi:hypothetical protein